MCGKVKRFQKQAQNGLENIFETWAKIIIRCSVCSFLLCLGLLIYCGFGIKYAKKFDQFPWAPAGNQTFKSLEKAADFFPQSLWSRRVYLSITGKQGPEDIDFASLLSIGAFEEMIEFDSRMKNEIFMEKDGMQLYYEDICETFSPRELSLAEQIAESMTGGSDTTVGRTQSRPCRRTPIPIDFVYNRITDTYSVGMFRSNE